MSDAVYAKSIIEFVWPIQDYGRKSVITNAFEAIERLERSYSKAVTRARKRQWTERRIRSIVDDEAPALEHYEITDLEKMAVREGKDVYRQSIERAARIASFLAHADEDFFGPQIEAQMAVARGMASAGASLAVAAANGFGEGADRQGQRSGDGSRSRASGDGK